MGVDIFLVCYVLEKSSLPLIGKSRREGIVYLRLWQRLHSS